MWGLWVSPRIISDFSGPTYYDVTQQQRQTLEREFLALYDTFGIAVFRHCYFRISDRDQALDLLQETFYRVWRHLDGGGTLEQPKAFIFRIAHNLIVDQYRRHTEDSLDAMLAGGFDYTDGSESAILQSVTEREITALMESLNPAYRDVVVMRYIDDMAVRDIAVLMGLTENTVSVRLHRGLQKLRDAMNAPETHNT